jgi:hypothetical protein
VLGVITAQAEPRYYLPLTVLVYLLVCFGPATRQTLLGGSRRLQAGLAVSFAAFLLLCLTLSSATEDEIEFPQAVGRSDLH